LTRERLEKLKEAGLDHVQVSIQDVDVAAENADRIAGYKGGSEKKKIVARWVRELGLPLTINAPIHRHNIKSVEAIINYAVELGADRVEIAHVQYYAWALKNRAALMPTLEQVQRALAQVEQLRDRYHSRIVIDAVVPDYYARYPKACVGGWGRRSLNVTPSGRVLPCHAAESIPGLEFWSVRDHSLAEIWRDSPAFRAFRGTDWMREPCRSCPRREEDFGGCRCQAFLLTGDARAADPVCHLSPHHAVLADLAAEREDRPYDYRR
jgi:pyrroloquinoline quinone biosynthesis protein E